MKKTEEFSHKALLLIQAIENKVKDNDVSASLSLTILTLKSIFDEGFAAGRFYERHGYYPSDDDLQV